MARVRLPLWRAARGGGYAVAAFFCVTAAQADEPLPAPIVAWDVPEECPNAQSIVQRLMTLAPGAPDGFAGAGTVRGAIVKEVDEWVLALRIVEGSNDGAALGADAPPGRVLRAKDCDDLADAAAVAIAIALGGAPEAAAPGDAAANGRGSAVLSRSAPGVPARSSAGSAVSHPATAAVIAPTAATTIATPAMTTPPAGDRVSAIRLADNASPPQSSIERPFTDARARTPVGSDGPPDAAETPPHGAGSAFGFVPSVELTLDATSLGGPTFGPSVQGELRWRSLGVAAYGLWLPERQTGVARAQYIELSLLSAGLRGCYRVARETPALDVCAGGEFGALEAESKGLLETGHRRDPWGAATGGVLLSVNLGSAWRAGLRLEAVVPLSRERYLVNGDQAIVEVPPANARLGLAFAGSFGAR